VAKFSALTNLKLVADAQTLGWQILPRMPDGKQKEWLESYLRREPPSVTRQQIAGHWLNHSVTAQKEQHFQDALECAHRATYADPTPSNKAFLGLSQVMLAGATKSLQMEVGLAALAAAVAEQSEPATLFNYMQALHMTSRLNDALIVADKLLALTPGDPLVVSVVNQIKKKMQ
jgi:tetratricopeptide (TPR) repeat protein